jgi:ADP-ribose pyrophosphatase YjhB (NUDIX family)
MSHSVCSVRPPRSQSGTAFTQRGPLAATKADFTTEITEADRELLFVNSVAPVVNSSSHAEKQLSRSSTKGTEGTEYTEKTGESARCVERTREAINMTAPAEPKWVEWAKRLQTMAQNGLHYSQDRYDVARYEAITEIAHEMMALGSGTELETVRELFAHEAGHATPKLDVRVAAFRDGVNGPEILMVRERRDGLWTLPGGWADVGETPSEAARREVREESGFEVEITRLLAVHDKRMHPHPPESYYIYKLFFEAKIVGSHSATGDGFETDAVAFFAPSALPPLSLNRVVPQQVVRMFELHSTPGAPAEFD